VRPTEKQIRYLLAADPKGKRRLGWIPGTDRMAQDIANRNWLEAVQSTANPGQIVGWVTVSDWGNVAAYVAPDFRGKTGSRRLSDIRTVFPTIVREFETQTGKKAKGFAFQWNRPSKALSSLYLNVKWPLLIRVYWGAK
jgi:hypothetical protein